MGKAEEGTGPYSVDPEAGSNSSQELYIEKPKTWKSFVWDTWELPKEERWLLFKVDAFLLTFASVCFRSLG